MTSKVMIKARAPLRLGLAGGGTDISPYCDEHTGCVLNATIDRFAYALIKKEKRILRFNAKDLNISDEIEPSFPLSINRGLKLHRAVYNHFIGTYCNGEPIAIEISTFCDAPAGSGLGSSSTLVVAMVRAFCDLLNISLDDYQIAMKAHEIERIDCGLHGGKQDHFAATFGGVNFIEFHKNNKTIVNPLRIKPWILNELEASLVLFYTGKSRESAKIIEEQIQGAKIGNSKTIQALHELKKEAIEMKEALLRGDFHSIAESMARGWENKKKSASTISTPLIDSVFSSAIKAGATTGKVSGAGGGGFIMFLVPTENRMEVIRSLSTYKGVVSNCHFIASGSESWRIS